MRILAYSQLLESYRSLTLDSLALSFGVTVDFIDTYVSNISAQLDSNMHFPLPSWHPPPI